MSIESLKEKARRHEQQEEWDAALELYLQAIRTLDRDEDQDISLYNRVGDLEVRVGLVEQAVEHYEKAVDLYVESELPNNAIAVCKKVARNVPDRHAIFLRMGQIRAQQGFLTDARQNFLAYAERKQAEGDLEEAFRALIELVEVVPDDTDIRLALAEQLAQHDRTEEAVEQLAEARRLLILDDRDDEAEAVTERLRALAPDAELPSAEFVRAGGVDAGEAVEAEAPDAGGGAEWLPDLGAYEPDDDEEEAEAPVADASAAAETGDAVPDATPDEERIAGFERFGFAADEPGEEGSGVPGDDAADEPDLREAEPEPAADEPASAEDRDVESEDEEDDLATAPLPMMHFDDEDDEEEAEPADRPAGAGLDPPEEGLAVDEALAMDEARESALEDAASERRPERGSDESAPGDGNGVGAATEEDDGGAGAGGFGGGWLSEVEAASGAGLAEPAAAEEDAPDEAGRAGADSGDEAEALRERGERLLDRGDDERGLALLERAHEALAAAGESEEAVTVMRRIARERPGDVPLRQRMVEYAYRTGDDDVLVTAYLDLAGALRRSGDTDRARSVYEQALDADPGNPEAREALTELSGGAAPAQDRSEVASSEEYVDLGSLVLDEEEEEKSTRFVVPAEAPTGDEQADFARMLSQFKEKVAENVGTDDVAAHYDLGTAYREMGLVDEAISEFQSALRADRQHLPTYEVLGQCFLDTDRGEAAVRTLERALEVPHEVEDELLGIYYYLARAHEQLGRKERALEYYEKVFALDINFMDVTERLRNLR